MKTLIIKAQHPVYIRNAEEEVQLLKNGSYQEKADYICCHTFKSREAQMILVNADIYELIQLQSYMSEASWYPEARIILEERCRLTRRDYDIADYKAWLEHLLVRSPSSFKSDKEYAVRKQALMSAGAMSFPVSGEDELEKRIFSGDPLLIRPLDRELPPRWVGPYVKNAPIESVFRYLLNFNIDTTDGQCNLIRRGNDALTWKMAICCTLQPEAMQMIEESGNLPLLYTATIRTYGWDVQKSLKLGSIRKLQEHLTAEFNKKYGTEMVL